MPREKLAKTRRKQLERKAAVRRRQIAGALEEWHASAFEHALDQFDAAARRLKLTENQIAMTKLPRRVTEVLRVIDSMQLTAKHRVATPANWKQGEDVIIAGSVTDDEAKKIYPKGWEAPKPYLRIVPQPR